jgi:hypothetical protein
MCLMKDSEEARSFVLVSGDRATHRFARVLRGFRVVANWEPHLGATSGLPVTRPEPANATVVIEKSNQALSS